MEPTANSTGKPKIISDGVAFIGRIVGSVAIIKLALRAVGKPPSDWLAAILKAYTDLFDPLVDYTIGLIPRIFGYTFESWAKDLLVIHALIASAVARAVVAQADEDQIQPGSLPSAVQWVGVFLASFLFWPFLAFVTLITGPILSLGASRRKNDPIFQAYWTKRSAYFVPLARKWRRELLLVFAIVAIAIVLNAAGEL